MGQQDERPSDHNSRFVLKVTSDRRQPSPSPAEMLVAIVSIASLVFLALLGAVGAKAGGANVWRATARVTFWGR